jgi:phosphoribosylformylglycinamidine cyclo-ligase
MYQVFNMGHRMELYVANQEIAALIMHISKEMFNVDAQVVGRVENLPEAAGQHMSKKVTIVSPYGTFEYT